MGFFRKKEKEYTLAEAMRILQRKGYESYMPCPVEPGNPYTKYWLRNEEKTVEESSYTKISHSPFQERRKRLMNEINVNTVPQAINRSYRNYTERAVKYNDYQSARNYQRKYGHAR